MKPNNSHFQGLPARRRESGVTLIEVVLAIAVFAFGMLALVQLQGNLTRSSADSNSRTVAANIAEELVEAVRGFRSVEADADNGVWDYLELQGNALNDTVNRGGIDYARTVTVSDFWWDPVNETFVRTETAEPPEELEYLAYSDFKLLRLDVSWDNSDEFYVDDDTTADLGSGSITVYEVIPSAPPILGARLSASNDGDSGPEVRYYPGELPNIVPLTLDDVNSKFKETTTPVPKVIRTDELAETWFDVVTYSGTGDAAVFLRREEFAIVSCECELEAADNDNEGGFRPTLWNGYDYTEGEFVQKNFGTHSGGSSYCVTCCRDHHDGGVGERDTSEVEALVYDPWNAPEAAPNGDHPHYKREKHSGDLVEANVGDEYVEACRMVRKDGFMRVTHDLDAKALVGAPEDYLDEPAEAAEYSAYVIEAVTDFVVGYPTSFEQPADLSYVIPASDTGNATALPTWQGGHDADTDTQQLRSRVIYADYPTLELRTNLANCPGNTCVVPSYTRDEEMYPFFELQTTWLANWSEIPLNDPVDTTMEPIESGNTHSRGVAELQAGGIGQSEVVIDIHEGNLGLTGTDPITPADVDPQGPRYVRYSLFVDTAEGEPPPVVGWNVEGVISETVGQGFKASDASIDYPPGVACNRTASGYFCIVPMAGGPFTLTVTAPATHKGNDLYICAASADLTGGSNVRDATTVSATFTLPTADVSGANIVIENTPCG